MEEIWKPVEGYEGLYEVSNLGRVKRLERICHSRFLKEKIITNCFNCNTGYSFVCLRKDDHTKNISLHRVVARAFVSNPNSYPEVNHVDGNKLNNNADNLEWCTRSENLKHALEIKLVECQCKIRRSVIVTNILTNVSEEFDSMKDCAEHFGFKKSWAHNRIRKHGNPFIYENFQIYVCERVDAAC